MHQSDSLSGYTGPIVFYIDMNAYLTISFIYYSVGLMAIKSYNGLQSSEASLSKHLKSKLHYKTVF